jgi:hypothetical protein
MGGNQGACNDWISCSRAGQKAGSDSNSTSSYKLLSKRHGIIVCPETAWMKLTTRVHSKLHRWRNCAKSPSMLHPSRISYLISMAFNTGEMQNDQNGFVFW